MVRFGWEAIVRTCMQRFPKFRDMDRSKLCCLILMKYFLLQPDKPCEFSAKIACQLYLAFEKRSRKAAKSADNMIIDTNHPIYIRDYLPDVFGDNGTLKDMQRLESGGDANSLGDLMDTKYRTRLALTWTEADTMAATEKATIIVKQMRDHDNDPSAAEVPDAEWLQWYSFEARFRLITEARLAEAAPPTPTKGKGRALRGKSKATDEQPQGILCRIFVIHSIASQ